MARCRLGRVKSGPRKGKCKKRRGKPWSTARKLRYGKTQRGGMSKTAFAGHRRR
jgi:hypothetical protein